MKMVFQRTLELTPNYTFEAADNLNENLRSTLNLHGNIAECGVYRGGTGLLIAEAVNKYAPQKKVFLLDSFEGLPKHLRCELDVEPGEFAESVDINKVQELFSEFRNVILLKGWFQDTFPQIVKEKFCFVHLDVDYVESYRQCYEFFWPRLVKGGRIICDEYGESIYAGVRAVTDNYFKRKKCISENLGRQCLIIKSM